MYVNWCPKRIVTNINENLILSILIDMRSVQKVKLYAGVFVTIKKHRVVVIPWLILMLILFPLKFNKGDDSALLVLSIVNLLSFLGIFWRRKSVVYYPEKGKVYLTTFYFLFKWKKAFDYNEIERVKFTDRLIVGGDNLSSKVYSIVFKGPNKEIYYAYGEKYVRQYAKQIAALLNRPFENELFAGEVISKYSPKVKASDLQIFGLKRWKQISVLAPEELWLSLAERWKLQGLVFEKPQGAYLNEIKVKEESNRLVMEINLEQTSKKWILFVFMALLLATIGLFFIGQYIFAMFFLLFTSITFKYSLSAIGKKRMAMTEKGIAMKFGLLPWRKAIPYKNIQELIFTQFGMFLVGDNDTIKLAWTKNNRDNAFLYQIIHYKIQKMALNGESVKK